MRNVSPKITLAALAAVAVLLVAGPGSAVPVGLTQTKTTAFDAKPGAWFGRAIDVDGDTMLVGAPFHGTTPGNTDGGAAYVYVRNPTTGAWTIQAALNPLDGKRAFYAADVALEGDTAVVGAAYQEPLGAVYVFTRNPVTGAWTQQVKLKQPEASTGGNNWGLFGYSVELQGDTLLVGAIYGDTPGAVDAGSVYVFARSPATGAWSYQSKLHGSDLATGDFFGISLALDGDTLVAGAYGQNGVLGPYRGAAYVFARNAATNLWTEKAKLVPADAAPRDFAGSAVAIDGDTVLVGSPQYAVGDHPAGMGKAHVYARDPATGAWSERARLAPLEPTAAGDIFGTQVAIDGLTAVVTAPYDTTSAGFRAGTAHVFVGTGATWINARSLTAGDAAPNAFFGMGLALDGDRVLVAAPNVGDASGVIYEFA